MGTIRVITDEDIAAHFEAAAHKRYLSLHLPSKQRVGIQQDDVTELFPYADVKERRVFRSAIAEFLQDSGFMPEEVADALYLKAYMADEKLFPPISHRWKRAVRKVAKERMSNASEKEGLPSYERVLVFEDIKRMDAENYMWTIFQAQELPNGRLTLAICDWLAISPLKLANTATIDAQPAYIVEAVVLDSKRQLARANKIDIDTTEFLKDQLILAQDMARHVNEFMNDIPIKRSKFDLIQYMKEAQRHYVANDYLKKHQKRYEDSSPVESMQTYLESVLLCQGEVIDRTIAARQKLLDDYKKYKNAKNLMRTCAVELAPSGKADDFIQMYEAYAQYYGYKRAARVLTLEPEKMTRNGTSPFRIGWRYNARLANGDKGEEVRDVFIMQSQYLHQKKHVRYATDSFVEDARADKAEWQKLMRSPAMDQYLQIEAVALLIMEQLGDYLIPPQKALPAPRPILSLPAPKTA
ncbi:MAG TPA: hypothetical protein VIN59_02850 [Alphaproteobacteria bacterium]